MKADSYDSLEAAAGGWRLAWKNVCMSLLHSGAITPLRTCSTYTLS